MARDPAHHAITALEDARLAVVFAVAFAICALFEAAENAIAFHWQARSVAQAATALAALAVLARPGSTARLLVLAAAFAVSLVVRLPVVPNHALFELGMCASLALAALLARRAGEGADLGAIVRLAAPAIRLGLLVMYGWAVVHKVNRDFFDPAVSCGPAQLEPMRRYLWWLVPDTAATRWFGIYGTLAVETAIPLLLCSRARHVGIALAVGFHWVLGARYARFSAMLIAPLVLFLDPAVLRRPAEALRPWIAARAGGQVGLAVAVVLSLAYLVLLTRYAGGPPVPNALHVVTVAWLVYGAACALALAALVWWRGALLSAGRVALRPAAWPLALVPVLLFVAGLAPHLGLKNTQAFAMYSNLRTENGATNHLFLPASLQLFPFTRDLVTVIESSDPVLARLTRRQWSGHTYFFAYVAGAKDLPRADAPRWTLPYLALRRRVTELALAGGRNVRLVYERAGVRHERRHAERDPELAGAWWLERKLMLMRAVPMTERGYCMW